MSAAPTSAATDPVPAHHAPRARSPLALSLSASLLLGAGLVLGNIALAKSNTRVDLTADRVFTLSDASKRVLETLTDPAKISVYWGEKLPPRAEPVRRRLEGLLAEYASESGGRLEVVWVKMDDAGQEEARKRGIHEGTYSELEANKVTEARDFDGISIAYESETEKVGPLLEISEDAQSLQLTSNLEYEISAALYKLARPRKAIIGLVRPPPPPAFMAAQGAGDDRYSVLAQAVLAKVYGDDFRDSVSIESPVPPEVTVLVVPGPKGLSEKQAFNLEQFVLRGGKLLLLLDPVNARQVFMGDQPPGPSGLEDWLSSVGVSVAPGVVGDLNEENMGAAATRSGLTGYPFFVRSRQEQINQENPGTRDFASVPFYFPSEIVVDAKTQVAAGREFSVLATTSEKGFVRKDTMALNSASIAPPPASEMGKKVLLVRIDGPFTSFWKGKPTPGEKPAEPATPPPGAPDAGMGEPAMAEGAMGESPAPVTPPGAPDAAMSEPAMAEPAMAEPSMDAPVSPIPQPPKPPEIPKAPAAPSAPEAPKTPEAPKAPPAGAKGPEGDAGKAGAPAKDTGPARLDAGKGMILVCGDAELVSDDFSGGRKDITQGVTRIWGGVNGFQFVNNLVDWMTGSDDLLSLRARGSDTHRLEEVKPETASTAQTLNYVAAPLLVLIAGALVFFVRKFRS